MQNQRLTNIDKLCLLLIVSLVSFLLLAYLLLFQGYEQDTSIRGPDSIPDFESIKDTREKKRRFFGFMRPYIEGENESILKKRDRLLQLYKKHLKVSIKSPSDRKWLDKLCAEYRVGITDIASEYKWNELMQRVDIVPLELALIQAAKESGWGTSRFAIKGNNVFGQRCFTKGCGIVPNERASDAKHEVVTFDSVEASVRSYIRNLNTNNAYIGFRRLRFEQRQAGQLPDGYALVSELPQYSERREAYLEEIRAMIKSNRSLIGS